MRKTLLTLASLVMVACVDGDTQNDGKPFLAFASTFQGYRQWPAQIIDTTVDPPASTHISGPRTAFINQLPSAGATEFPIGTVIVKELESGNLSDRQVFAMVKRGGGYNSEGATGWEWFELKNIDEDNVDIVWRGVGPPAGEKYGGDPNGGCNGCHAAAKANDFVHDQVVDLSAP
jgi:Cytochrome P460